MIEVCDDLILGELGRCRQGRKACSIGLDGLWIRNGVRTVRQLCVDQSQGDGIDVRSIRGDFDSTLLAGSPSVNAADRRSRAIAKKRQENRTRRIAGHRITLLRSLIRKKVERPVAEDRTAKCCAELVLL